MLTTFNRYFEQRKNYGAIFIRVIVGWRLIDGTQDNVFSWERMIEFRDFLSQHNVIFPLLSAQLSVYAQFVCGILFILGFQIRVAAVIMIVNFVVALLVVHLGLTFEQSFDALMMLAGSLFLLFHGAGKFSIDNYLRQKE